MRCWTGAVLVLCLGVAAAEPAIDLAFQDLPLTAALQQLATAGGLALHLDDLGAAGDVRVTAEFHDVTATAALQRLVGRIPDLQLTHDGAGWTVKPTVTPPPPPAAAPAPPAPAKPGPGLTPRAADGVPGQASKRYALLKMQFAYAPGLAQALGGHSLLLSDLDPWAAMVGQSPATRGRQPRPVFPLPAGLHDVVGVDWLSSLIAH